MIRIRISSSICYSTLELEDFIDLWVKSMKKYKFIPALGDNGNTWYVNPIQIIYIESIDKIPHESDTTTT